MVFPSGDRSEDVKTTDLTSAEELVRGLTFDKYNEEISCKILSKIKKEDFEEVVDRIATRHKIPENYKQAILDGKFGEVNREVIREFKFEKGKHGTVQYGRTLTIRRKDGTIDLAYALFSLEFKLSPIRIEERIRKRFLFITYGSRTIVRFEERNLSEKDKDNLFDFYRSKALKGFMKEYPALEIKRDEL
ncbi:hypothetical protein AC249_AIPGENE6409 [Exaiptasia diaphana]|nr:hypothetical protein AC249_AIPGENE6409 [Exaiptasia diaphana]